MENQPIPSGIATESNPAPGVSDITDSRDGVPHASGNWWMSVASVNRRTVQTAERTDLVNISLGGRRCLITGETAPSAAIQMCHLIPKSTGNSQLQRFQYTFGRKLNLNSRWFNVFLRSDMHLAFDAVPSGWALVPLPSDVQEIKAKISTEKARRKRAGIKGPWPDFRSAEWFPTKRSGYEYQFVPLGFVDEQVTILRQEWTRNPVSHDLYGPPLENFPLLRSHIHPYAVIVNAFPKLRRGQDYVSPSINSLLGDLLYIYDFLTGMEEEIPLRPSRSRGTPSNGSRSSTPATGPLLSFPRRSNRLGRFSSPPNDNKSRDLTPHADSGEPADFDDLFDDSEGDASECFDELDTMSESLPISTSASTQSGPPLKEEEKVRLNLPPSEGACFGSGRRTVVEWVAEVECARHQGQLIHPEDDDSFRGKQYAMEPCRPPPACNWHDWTSEFAPWWVLLPKRKERGAISSNDWVEIQNRLPLTRQLD